MASNMEPHPPRNLLHHLSRPARRREASEVKKFYKYFTIPGMGNFAGGLPNPNYFPYDTLEAKVALPERFKPTPAVPVQPPPSSASKASDPSPDASRLIVPHDDHEPNPFQRIDIASALQYGTAQGYPALHAFIQDFAVNKLHPNIPYAGGASTILTCGSTDGFSKIIDMCNNIWDPDRDWIRDRESMLCEEFAYMQPIQVARPRGLNVVPVAIDGEGMMAEGPGGLADVLSHWDKSKGRVPHLMYTVTMGQNPTSGLLSLTRRRQIYALCQQYDILIIEDDPYWYLQYPSANELSIKHRKRECTPKQASDRPTGWKSSGSAFLDSLVPSYLNIDVDGRVLRLDTFSKTVAPGCRLGWITAQPAFIERLERITETNTQQPSGFVQSLIAELILGPSHVSEINTKNKDKNATGWQMDGWIRWLEGLRGNYERRMQVMSQILEDGKHTVSNKRRRMSSGSDDFEVLSKSQMYDFDFPEAGMFLWMKVHYETHPLYDQVDHPRLALALWIFLTTEKYKVLLAPGTLFSSTEQIKKEKAWQYFRFCFAAVNEDLVGPLSQRFVSGIGDFWDIDDTKKIDDILNEDEALMDRRLEKLTLQSQEMRAINPIVC